MGTCFSKKGTSSSSPCPLPDPTVQIEPNVEPENKKTEESLKKEVFVIKHRKSHEIDRHSNEEKSTVVEKMVEISEIGNSTTNAGSGNGNGIVVTAQVRTSSCTKEEVDAILIQCGRLSRSSSTGKAASGGRKYSGSKRSYDFDHDFDKKKDNGSEDNSCNDNVVDCDEDEATVERIHRHRQRHRQSRAAASSPHGRRRTPSRERDQQQQQRSGSRERGSNGGARRVSRSPNRRSESPITTSNGITNATPSSANANNSSTRPGKMVSVPATVSSLAMDKSNNGGGGGVEPSSAAAVVKRIQVKRNVGESPRSRSPARGNIRVSNENQNPHSNQHHQQQPLSLSRSNSKKAEQSPYRRNPLSEIDTNAANNNHILHQGPMKKPNAENLSNVGVNVVVPSGPETLKPQTLTRSRSSRQSRDLDINLENSPNPSPSYTALLLEDIQNFHQKNTTGTTPSFSLPACVTKANSILEAVADLNSATSSNLSSAFSEDRKRNHPTTDQFSKNGDNSASNGGKKRLDNTKDPIVESEVIVTDDLMEPSFHKYVTVRRGPLGGGDIEEQESSGSNSFAGVQQQWLSSSSWEPNSVDSTDCWTSSRSTNSREDDPSPVGFQGCDTDEARKRTSDKKRESGHQKTGIGRGRVGSSGGVYKMPTTAAAAAST